jgi:formylglycine-generating enzyme required for sulfatase activity
MELNKALSLLAVSENATKNDIQQALSSKLAELQTKKQAAPTDALKAKFDTIIAQHQQAAELLLNQESDANQASGTTQASGTSQAPKKPSALSQTQIDDLPGFATNDTAHVELQPGTMLANRYEIKELIGQGGMGVVYRAFDKNRDEDIAIKLLLPSLTKNERALERFLNEARISSKLSHPNIVNVFDVQNDGDLYFLTMELLEGQDLRQIMDNQTTVGRPFEIDDIKEYIQGITDGLNHAHKFTVHRDIKPENIWITEEGEVKLMDFGIAQLQSTSQRTQTGAAMGTAYYMAPEQLKGKSDIDGRADQYAVAVLMYELLTGEVPAGMIEPVNEARPDTPTPMVDAIHQALKPKPENRFANMDDFNEQVQRSKGGRGSNTGKKKSGSNSGDGSSEGAGNKSIIIILLIIFVAIALGVGGGAYSRYIDEQARIKQVEKEKKLLSQLNLQMQSIPGGSFKMGSKQEKDEQPIHNVSIKPFKIMSKEVTVGQFRQFVDVTGYKTDAERNKHNKSGCYINKDWKKHEYVKGYSWSNPSFNQTDNHPVVCVSYWDGEAFVKWLNKNTGQVFSLPSEAQWEYAARGGSNKKYHYGNSTSQLCQYGNVMDNTPLPNGAVWTKRAKCDDGYLATAPVGQYQPNQFGLYDMIGNVAEWTQDCWNDSYRGAPANGKAWKKGSCAERVLRGGSWDVEPDDLRSADRFRDSASFRGHDIGFRLVQGR